MDVFWMDGWTYLLTYAHNLISKPHFRVLRHWSLRDQRRTATTSCEKHQSKVTLWNIYILYISRQNLMSRYRDNERCMKRKRILNINPTVDSSPLESKLDEISFLALISKPKHLEKISTGCMTMIPWIWHLVFFSRQIWRAGTETTNVAWRQIEH